MIVLHPFRRKVKVLRGIDCPEKWAEYVGYPLKIMVWGCIGTGGYKSQLRLIGGNLNAQAYVNMLYEAGVLEELDLTYGRMNYIFQEDGASPHRAAYTRQYLAGKVRSLPSDLHWPASSPDLSVIEPCWAILKRSINIQNVHNTQDLFAEACRAWNAITEDTINVVAPAQEPLNNLGASFENLGNDKREFL